MRRTEDPQQPDLTIRVRHGRGVERICLTVDDRERDSGMDWLARLLPSIERLDAAVRERR
jgi:hypothetical protein